MSPFLFFSNEKRAQIQTEFPNMRITEVSAKLGEIWREMTDEEKAPYIEKSKSDRDRYKTQQSEFKGKNPPPATVFLLTFYLCRQNPLLLYRYHYLFHRSGVCQLLKTQQIPCIHMYTIFLLNRIHLPIFRFLWDLIVGSRIELLLDMVQ